MKAIIRTISVCLLLPISITSFFAQERLGSDLAAPKVSVFLQTLPIKGNQLYSFSDADTDNLINLAATLHINVFEMIDCIFRYAEQLNMRILISGTSLRKAQTNYDLGGERVLAILPVTKLKYLETGAIFSPSQKDFDIVLEEGHQSYIEIGTAVYEPHFGFSRMTPNLFDQAYGITVKKLFFSSQLEKLELYSPGKGAIYVKGLSRPKRWNLNVVTIRK